MSTTHGVEGDGRRSPTQLPSTLLPLAASHLLASVHHVFSSWNAFLSSPWAVTTHPSPEWPPVLLIPEGEGQGRVVREPVHPRGLGRPGTAISMPCPATGWLCDLREVTPPLVSSFSISEVNGLDSACSDMCLWPWCCGSVPGSPPASVWSVPSSQGLLTESSPADKMASVLGSGPVSESASKKIL